MLDLLSPPCALPAGRHALHLRPSLPQDLPSAGAVTCSIPYGGNPPLANHQERTYVSRVYELKNVTRERIVSVSMSDHHRETLFLRQCILYEEGAERQQLEERIGRIQQDARCVRRAAWLMALLTALVVAGLGYAMVLVDNFPYSVPHFIITFALGVGVGSLISLLVFLSLGRFYRMRLDQRREECRRLVAKILESRLGKPVPLRRREDSAAGQDPRTVPVPAGDDRSLARNESTALG